MKKLMKTLIALVLLAGIVFTGVQVAGAASIAERPSLVNGNQVVCLGNGGSWVGPTDYIGACTYSPDSVGHASYGACSDTEYTIVSFGIIDASDRDGKRFSRSVARPASGPAPIAVVSCKDIPGSGPGYGKCGNEAGKTDDAALIVTCQGVSVAFDAGSCTGKCTVSPKLLNTARKGLSQLDGEVLGEAYVKVRNPGGGSYKICIPGEGTIYKWVSGAWVAQATQTVNGVSCAWSSGDGNYVLVSP